MPILRRWIPLVSMLAVTKKMAFRFLQAMMLSWAAIGQIEKAKRLEVEVQALREQVGKVSIWNMRKEQLVETCVQECQMNRANVEKMKVNEIQQTIKAKRDSLTGAVGKKIALSRWKHAELSQACQILGIDVSNPAGRYGLMTRDQMIYSIKLIPNWETTISQAMPQRMDEDSWVFPDSNSPSAGRGSQSSGLVETTNQQVIGMTEGWSQESQSVLQEVRNHPQIQMMLRANPSLLMNANPSTQSMP